MIVDIKGVGQAQFPDDMAIADIRSFLRNKYYDRAAQGQSDILSPQPQTASPYEPTLTERLGGGIADGLKGAGLISDNYGAQQIGKNVTALGEFLPGIGDASAGDEFGRAVAEGDNLGMGLAALGAIPVVGDAARRGARAFDDLPMDDVSRIKELKDEGFDLEGTWYHGSDKDFDEFDFSRVGDNYDSHYGRGAYFASRFMHASEHGKVKNYKLAIKNPMKWSLQKVQDARDKGMELSEYAKSLGHDGILVGDRHNAQIVAFDNNQIKLDDTEY